MKLIVLLLSALLGSPQSSLEAWPFFKGQMQEHHVLPMLIYFSSDHCLECDQFDALFDQPEMLQRMEQHYVSVRVSIDDTNGKACADIYRIETVPAFVIADHKGVILYKSDESLSVEVVQLLLENVPGKYSTVRQPEEKIAEDNASMYAINGVSKDQPTRIVSSLLPVEERALDLQSAEAVADVHIEELQPVQVIPVLDPPTVIEKIPVMNISPAPNEADPKPAMNEASSEANTKPAEIKSSPSAGEAAKPVAPKPPVRIQRSYSIQLGYFTETVNSKKLVERAKAKGLTATRTQTEQREGKSFYRVLIGDFKTLAAAQEQLAEVHTLGFKGAVHRQ